MQQELRQTHPELGIEILSINQVGLGQSAGDLGERGYGIPILQDTLEVNAWGLWWVNFRDFFILDSQGQLVSITQLSPPDEGGGGIVGDQDAYVSIMDAMISASEGR